MSKFRVVTPKGASFTVAGGGYDDRDMVNYFRSKGVNRTGTLEAVSMDGVSNAPGDPSGADGEVQLDIEVAGSVAPGANIVAYFSSNQGSGFLQHRRADGSYVSLVRDSGTRGTAWSTIIEATTATAAQRAVFHVTGGDHLAGKTVHVWASNLSTNGTGGPARWFVRQDSIRPSRSGQFSLTIQPGWVYSLTTTSGQGHGRAAGRAPVPLRLSAVEAALQGVGGVFSVQLVAAPGTDAERLQGFQLIEAARKAGVDQFVHTSVSAAGSQST